MSGRSVGRVVVIGSFNVDHVWSSDALPRPGETLAGCYASGPGGKGFNQATASARAGARTHFVCALGDDVGGQWARSLTLADGIDLHDQRSIAPTGTAGIFVDAQGRNSIVIGAGANGELSATHVIAQPDVFANAAVVLAQLESPLPAIAAALRLGRDAGAITLLNPAPANASTTLDLLSGVDVLTPNESELAALLYRHAATRIEAGHVAHLPDEELHRLCRLLHATGTVVVTLGEHGCFVSHAAGSMRGDAAICYRVSAVAARVVDTTGAGDAFNGALAAALAMRPETDFRTHVTFASHYAGRSTEHPGAARSMPYLPVPRG